MPPLGTDEATRLIIDELKAPETVKWENPVSNVIKTEKYKQGWKGMKERTSRSYWEGLQFGMFKAGGMLEVISEFEEAMCNIPYCTGYSPR